MLYKHFTEKLLGLQGLNITNIEENEKSIIIYADPVNKRVLDILPERYKPYLTNYFKQYPKEVRNRGTLRKEGASVIFAKGELYCFAVI